MSENLEAFGKLYISVLNGALVNLKAMVEEESPARISQNDSDVMLFISTMGKEDRKKLENVVTYFVDMALYSFLNKLQAGGVIGEEMVDYQFELKIRNEVTDEESVIIGYDLHQDLHSKYFEWRDRYQLK